MKDYLAIIKDFLPLIGVFFGFFLATVKDFIQNKIENKPKIKMDFKFGKFNFFYSFQDELANVLEQECQL